MMAHEHNLPAAALRYRQRGELRTIATWLDDVSKSGLVLDVGCGSGAWTESFAERYRSVIGIEQSALMVNAAQERAARRPNMEIREGDARTKLPEGPFDMIFLGGLCMYLNDADVVALLDTLRGVLSDQGSIILRESTVCDGVYVAKGEYQAVYRSVNSYRRLFEKAAPFSVEIRRNYGYTAMVTAEELVDLRRRWMPFLPKKSATLGSVTWWALRIITPLSFWALPRVFSRLGIVWPRLQNHFFRLRVLRGRTSASTGNHCILPPLTG